MAVMEMPAEMPDVFGIPEYRCTEMRMEISGHDIRMVFGDRRFGQIHWLYTAIVAPENLLAFCHEAGTMALEAIDSQLLMELRRERH